MKARLVPVILMVLALGGFGKASQQRIADVEPQQSIVTFNKDVAPIMFEHCSPCHRPGQPVPFTLLQYSDVKPRMERIARVTKTRQMPPWLPEPSTPPFIGERRLRDDQIEMIQRWVEAGALEGDPADLPKAPTWTGVWQLGQPDVVATMSRPYLLQPGRSDTFRNLVLPLSLPASRFVRAVEFRPGSSAIHHAIMRVDRTSASRRRDGDDGQPGFPFDGMSSSAEDPGGYFIGWAPGQGPIVAPEGMPWRLERGSDLVVEVHLPPGATPTTVQPSIGLYFSDTPPVRMPVMVVMESKTIDIPAGVSDHEITDTYVLPVDVELLSVYPHAHYLGKAMHVHAVLPDGSTRRLLQINRWSFNWQQDYRYATPVALPLGTTLIMRYRYDNSDGNKDNPHHPPQRVTYGQRSSDEMGTLGLQLLPRSSADAAVLVEAFTQRQLLAAVAGAEMLVRLDPENADNQQYLGRSYAAVGRSEAAIAHFEHALRLNPRNARAHGDLGAALFEERRIEDALARLRQAVALAPRDEQLHGDLGKVLYGAGMTEEAAREFERAIELNPDFVEAHGNLGLLLATSNRLDEAIVHFRRVAELAPDSAVAQSDLGAALAQAGRIEEAFQHIRRALEISPTFAPALENLARLERQGR